MEYSGTSDTDKLRVYVANDSPIPIDLKELPENLKAFDQTALIDAFKASFTPSVSNNSTVSPVNMNAEPNDFASMNGDLRAIVPSGFIMIHNDLRDLEAVLKGDTVDSPKKQKINESNSGPDLLSLLSSGMGAKAAASGSAKMAGAGIMGKILPLLTNPYVLGGTAAVAGIALLVNHVKNKDKREAENHMEDVMNEITMDMTAKDALANPEVIKARDDSFVEYLKAYYKQQTNSMKAGMFVDAIATSIGAYPVNVIKGFVNSISSNAGSGKVMGPETKLEEIVNILNNKVDPEEEADRDDIIQVQHDAMAEYVKAYYDAQTIKLKTNSVVDSLATGAGNVVGGFIFNTVKSLFTGIKIPISPFENVVQALNDRITPDYAKILISEDDGTSEDSIIKIQEKAIRSYVKVYYANMVAKSFVSSTTSTMTDAAGNIIALPFVAIGKAIGNIADIIFGEKNTSTGALKPEDIFAQTAMSVINESMNNNRDALISKLAASEDIEKAHEEGIASFVKTYYTTMATQMATENASETATNILKNWFDSSWIGQVWNGIKGLLGFGEEKTETEVSFTQKMSDILGDTLEEVINNSDTSNIANSDEVKGSFNNGISAFVLKFFEMAAEQVGSYEEITNNKNWFGGKDIVTKVYENQLVSQNTLDIFSLKLNDIINKVSTDASADKISKDERVIDAFYSGTASFVENILSRTGDSTSSYLESTALLDEVTDEAFMSAGLQDLPVFIKSYIITAAKAAFGVGSTPTGADYQNLSDLTKDNTDITNLRKEMMADTIKIILNKTNNSLRKTLSEKDFEIDSSFISTAEDVSKSYQDALKASMESIGAEDTSNISVIVENNSMVEVLNSLTTQIDSIKKEIAGLRTKEIPEVITAIVATANPITPGAVPP